jgi:hypothetical protein
MAIVFQEYGELHRAGVREFNSRIAGRLEAGLELPGEPQFDWLPKGGNPQIWQEAFLLLDDGVVRGGYILRQQDFALNGAVRRIAAYRLPISEGVANRAFASLGLHILRNAVARQPFLFSLGMGSVNNPLPKMQKSLGWSQYPVPFYFKVLRGGEFLRNIGALRTTRLRRAACDFLAGSGLGAFGFGLRRALGKPRLPGSVVVEEFRGFGPWADELWDRCRPAYSLVGVRNANAANALYPSDDRRFLCFRVTCSGRLLGWAVGLDTQMKGHKQFGNMRVATIVDGLAEPQDAELLLAAVSRTLEHRGSHGGSPGPSHSPGASQGIDLIVSNQMHEAWGRGLKKAGFFEGPSNFIFSASKTLSAAIAPFETEVTRGHINRGDGDGPVHL